ncbi:MAG: cyclic nucleotide-binding domain-containing protein [Coleofasciculus sp. S288]|nr:cyclic nucleotide-binding domain-containing protein [Coleofasciculus sp. S288]
MTDSLEQLRNILREDPELRQNVIKTVHLSDGEILFHRGDPGDAFYLIETGQIRIFTLDREGKEITLNTLSAGETLGELALVDSQPRSASAIAIGSSTLLRLKGEDFLERVYKSPILTQCIIQLLSQRARHMTEYIEQLGHWARLIIDGQYDQVLKRIEEVDTRGERAVAAVAGSLRQMVKAVRQREERLLEEVTQLRIEIDQEKRKQQVEEITKTDVFKKLAKQAGRRRRAEPT